MNWGAIAIFVGPLIAAVAVILLRWLGNNGYLPHALVLGSIASYFAYRHFNPH